MIEFAEFFAIQVKLGNVTKEQIETKFGATSETYLEVIRLLATN